MSIVWSKDPSISSCHHHSSCSVYLPLSSSWTKFLKLLCIVPLESASLKDQLLLLLKGTCLCNSSFVSWDATKCWSMLWFPSRIFWSFHQVHLRIFEALLFLELLWWRSKLKNAHQLFQHLHLNSCCFEQDLHTWSSSSWPCSFSVKVQQRPYVFQTQQL